MRVLIFGITGMLGHVVWQTLKIDHEVYGTLRHKKSDLLKSYPFFRQGQARIIDQVDAMVPDSIDAAIETADPDVIINCVGIIKQLDEANDPVKAIFVNALFPHLLAKRCKEQNIRLIQISTDCVFSGKRGRYVETDVPDVKDLYGTTKCMGEVAGANSLTIRTSLIGRDLIKKVSLLEWFLSQSEKVNGYRNAVFSGLTTYAFSVILKRIINECPELRGLYHVSSHPISKFELLTRLKRAYKKDIRIVPKDDPNIDRSLDPSKFVAETSINMPTWDEMIVGLPLRQGKGA